MLVLFHVLAKSAASAAAGALTFDQMWKAGVVE
jgi:hypothetical protein